MLRHCKGSMTQSEATAMVPESAVAVAVAKAAKSSYAQERMHMHACRSTRFVAQPNRFGSGRLPPSKRKDTSRKQTTHYVNRAYSRTD